MARRGRVSPWSGALLWLVAASLSPPVAMAAAAQTPMTFRLVDFNSSGCGADCPQVIIADGVIGADTPQAFVDFAKQAAQARALPVVIFLNSPGGNVVASMELGTEFRKVRAAVMVAGFATMDAMSGPVPGECQSACVYALMGATRRVAPPVSRIVLHRMSIGDPGGGGGVADRQMVAELARYAIRMGVSPALVWRAESLAPGALLLLSTGEIARWRLASTRF
jgi:hypothetical protein